MAKVNDRVARMLQLAVMNALLKQISANPLEVPASLLAVAQRELVRYNMGLESFAEDTMTPDELAMVKEFESLELNLDSDLFDCEDKEPPAIH